MSDLLTFIAFPAGAFAVVFVIALFAGFLDHLKAVNRIEEKLDELLERTKPKD